MRARLRSAWLALASLGALAGGCSAPPGTARPFDLVGVGLTGRLDGEGARAGLTFAHWSTGYRGWGSFAKLRVDALTGLDAVFFDPEDEDDAVTDEDDDVYDDHVGVFAFDGGLVYRFADDFAVYGGAGIGNKYEYDAFEDADGDRDSSLHALKWGVNVTGGLIWMWGASGTGMELGFDSFDRSARLSFVVNYAGSGGNWLD